MKKPAPKPKAGLMQRLVESLFISEKPAGRAVSSTASRKSDPRAELGRMIQNIRARMDPRLLKLGEKLAKSGPPTDDRGRAQMAVEMFLLHKKDGGAFQAKLAAKLKAERDKLH